MANKKISQLTKASSLSGSDLSLVVNEGRTKCVSLSTLKQFINTGDPALSSSNNWNNSFTIVNSTSSVWNEVHLTVNSLSSNWQSVFVTTNVLSSKWDSVYTTVQSNSASWDLAYTTASAVNTTVQSNSASWDSTYTTVQSNSASWIVKKGQQTIEINATNTYVQLITGNILVFNTFSDYIHNNTPIARIPNPAIDGDVLYVVNRLEGNQSLNLQYEGASLIIYHNDILTLLSIISGGGYYKWIANGYP